MKEKCDRCGAVMGAVILSKFNSDSLCIPCKADEMNAPGYEQASKAEADALRGGNVNFPGIGLSQADRNYLAERRAARAVR